VALLFYKTLTPLEKIDAVVILVTEQLGGGMQTIETILKLQRQGRQNEGSCFGVTDPSRLRKTIRRKHIPHNGICEGCRKEKKRHSCKKIITVINLSLAGNELKSEKGTIECICSKCKK
jgi:hypothetical protein